MSTDFANKSVDIWLLLSSDMVTSRKQNINSNRDSIRLSMKQRLIENAGILKNGTNRTCGHQQLPNK